MFINIEYLITIIIIGVGFITLLAGVLQLQNRFEQLRSSLLEDVESFRSDLQADAEAFRAQLKDDIADFRFQIKKDMETFQADLKGNAELIQTEIRDDFKGLREDYKAINLRVDGHNAKLSTRIFDLNNKFDSFTKLFNKK